MTGNLGSADNPLTHHGERVNFVERTSDPSSTVEGEMWLRVDEATEDNQLATLRFDHGDGVWDIPVFETGTAVETVVEVLRVPINGTIGYVPVVPTDDSNMPELGFQHDSSRYALHDRVEPGSAIPDSAVLHWPHDEGSGTTLAETLSTYVDQDGTINGATWLSNTDWWGGQYLEYDGLDDHTATGTWGDWGSTGAAGGFSIVIECAVPDGDDGYFLGADGGTSGDENLFLGVGTREFVTGEAGEEVGIMFRERIADNRASIRTDADFGDGQRHLFGFNVHDPTDPNTWEIYVDNGFVSVSLGRNESPSPVDLSVPVYFGALNVEGSPDFHSGADMGRTMVTDHSLTESELDDLAQQHGFST